MKKLAAIAVAFILAVGLAAVMSPADAAYPPSVQTSCHVNFKKNVIRHGHEDKVRFRVSTNGTGRARGTVKIVTQSHRHTYTRVYNYRGGNVYHFFPRMKRGKYQVHMRYIPKAGSVFMRCGKWGHSVRVR
jgi:hypothetical protein